MGNDKPEIEAFIKAITALAKTGADAESVFGDIREIISNSPTLEEATYKIVSCGTTVLADSKRIQAAETPQLDQRTIDFAEGVFGLSIVVGSLFLFIPIAVISIYPLVLMGYLKEWLVSQTPLLNNNLFGFLYALVALFLWLVILVQFFCPLLGRFFNSSIFRQLRIWNINLIGRIYLLIPWAARRKR
jgi:hypothetical protein